MSAAMIVAVSMSLCACGESEDGPGEGWESLVGKGSTLMIDGRLQTLASPSYMTIEGDWDNGYGTVSLLIHETEGTYVVDSECHSFLFESEENLKKGDVLSDFNLHLQVTPNFSLWHYYKSGKVTVVGVNKADAEITLEFEDLVMESTAGPVHTYDGIAVTGYLGSG